MSKIRIMCGSHTGTDMFGINSYTTYTQSHASIDGGETTLCGKSLPIYPYKWYSDGRSTVPTCKTCAEKLEQ